MVSKRYKTRYPIYLKLRRNCQGTGLNTPDGYDHKVAEYIAQFTGHPFTRSNKFEALPLMMPL
jgi:fumarate hydratase class II